MNQTITEEASHFLPQHSFPLHIHNIGSSVSEFYELQFPYFISYQATRSNGNPLTMISMMPNGYLCNSFSLKEVEFLKNRSLHQHDFFEIMFVLSGNIIQNIESKSYSYSAGQCCVLNRNVRHREEFTGDYEVLFIMLHNEFLEELLEHDIQFSSDGTVHNWFGSIYHLIQKNQKNRYFDIKEYIDFTPTVLPKDFESFMNEFHKLINQMVEESAQQKPGCSFMIKGLISRFFSMLETSDYQKSIVCLSSKKEENILLKISHLLEARNGRITREELVKELNYNGDYLNRIVKKYTGMTLVEYGQIFCLKKAETLLINEKMSIAEIVTALGFSNRSYFYRIFYNRYGMTPNDYRKNRLRAAAK